MWHDEIMVKGLFGYHSKHSILSSFLNDFTLNKLKPQDGARIDFFSILGWGHGPVVQVSVQTLALMTVSMTGSKEQLTEGGDQGVHSLHDVPFNNLFS